MKDEKSNKKTPYPLIRYYDTCCEECGNWAASDLGPLPGTIPEAVKALAAGGWKVVDDRRLCSYCATGTPRPILSDYPT